MQKIILYGSEARQKVADGVNKVADAVITTMGPRGRSAIIARSFPSQNGMQYYQPIVSKDGVTVSRNIMLTDYMENVGCLMIKETAEKTMALAGDGTTASCLLVKEILNEGLKLIDNGENPQQLRREIEEAVQYVVSELKKMAIPLDNDSERIKQIATVSANNDPVIGQLIADAFATIGKDGILTIEESKSTKTEIKLTEGFKMESGWISPYFINDHAKGVCELNNPYILLYDKKLYQLKPLQQIMEQIMAREGSSVLIICPDADGEALSTLTFNAVNGKLKVCIIKAPFGENKIEEMEDIALLTGGVYISDEKGYSLEGTKLSQLGRAKKVVVSKDDTIITGSAGKKEDIDETVSSIREKIAKSDDELEKEKLSKRIAKLTGSAAVLLVGAATETEMKEKVDRCDDAIKAVKSAISEGFVAGGGTAFIRISENMPVDKKGFQLILSVLPTPLMQICKNAGVDPLERVAEVAKATGNTGYNGKTEKVEDLVKAGIIDPAKVLRCSLEHAASTATMILTSETLICDSL